MNIKKIVQKAGDSAFYLWLLNQGLSRMIPFNKPHGFKVVHIDENSIKTELPFKKRNFNHIKGIHACALATLSEFTTGFLMVSRLDPSKYRIILKTLEMDYHYQGKMKVQASFQIGEKWLEKNVYEPLQSSESTVVVCEVKVFDLENNHISTGRVHWQVKSWDKVKTKIK
ncbi:DUF4442 domain-containing protein [Fulvivirga sediminis]|uniref:DUF4442 domain-containing protein n=1 Tax=Fulvivirga sediminis TaxID=2803949 RepID=A0A937F4Z2_9BACT|nr:DUF4442 domain-containing protein [Fulvivirga sediminis]MBL3656492.1 DUF4442 domain-containing protein [Fulvivirga sediminis]